MDAMITTISGSHKTHFLIKKNKTFCVKLLIYYDLLIKYYILYLLQCSASHRLGSFHHNDRLYIIPRIEVSQ